MKPAKLQGLKLPPQSGCAQNQDQTQGCSIIYCKEQLLQINNYNYCFNDSALQQLLIARNPVGKLSIAM